LLAEWTELGEFSGVVLDSRGGETVFAEAYGTADRRYDIPNTLETAFNVGSLNKAFTGAAIMLLEEEGKVDLDAYLGDYLDGFSDDVARSVTVRHLLQHTSGWSHYWDNETFLEHLGDMRETSDYLAFIREIPLGFEPGTFNEYSNIGYEVLDGIIEATPGMSHFDFIQQRIFDPLGMTRSGFPMKDQPTRGVASGYTRHHPHATEEGYTMENTYPAGATRFGGWGVLYRAGSAAVLAGTGRWLPRRLMDGRLAPVSGTVPYSHFLLAHSTLFLRTALRTRPGWCPTWTLLGSPADGGRGDEDDVRCCSVRRVVDRSLH